MARAQVREGATPGVEACVAAYESGQRERLAGSLRAARGSFLTCSQEACPRVARVDCTAWLSEVERLAPSLVFSVKGPDGVDLPGVELTVDGARVEGLADGRALTVDPGTHVVRVAAAGHAAKEQRLVVVEGEKARLLRFDFEAAAVGPRAVTGGRGQTSGARAESGETPRAPAPPNAWLTPAAFGLSGAALVGFGAVGLWGLAGKRDLDGCKPACSHAAVTRIETRFLVADVLLLVGLVSGGFATYRALTTPAQTAVTGPRLTIDVAGAGRDEASLHVRGRF